eukprot:2551329-Pyramimonas_sp.AAC.1
MGCPRKPCFPNAQPPQKLRFPLRSFFLQTWQTRSVQEKNFNATKYGFLGVLHLPQATAASPPQGRAAYPTEPLKSRCRGHHWRQTASFGLFLRAKKMVPERCLHGVVRSPART